MSTTATAIGVTNTQTAPWPVELADMVEQVSYRAHEGWQVQLDPDCARDEDADGNVIGRGLTLVVTTCGYNSYHPDRGPTYRVHHYFIVPAATYNRASWCRWLFDQLCKVEMHEAMEHFTLVHRNPSGAGYTLSDGSHSDTWTERPYSPNHGPGHDPYQVRELATGRERRTSFRGLMNPS